MTSSSLRAPTRLSGLHRSILALHKSLLDFERKQYEATHGRITSPHELLKLVMSHPSFDWLRTLSGLIVSIDELESEKEQKEAKTEQELITTTKKLLVPSEEGDTFAQKYSHAFEQSPEVVHAHGEVMQELKKLR